MGSSDKGTHSKDKPTTAKLVETETISEAMSAVEEGPKNAKITLKTYCDCLGKEGLNKFAFELISSRLMQWSISSEDRTNSEWETLYLKAQEN